MTANGFSSILGRMVWTVQSHCTILNDLAEDRDILVAKVDTDANTMHAARLGVRGIPALFLSTTEPWSTI